MRLRGGLYLVPRQKPSTGYQPYENCAFGVDQRPVTMAQWGREDTESYDGEEALEDARELFCAADDRQARRRRGIDPERFPQIRAGPPARRLGIETMASGSTVASPVVEGTPVPIRGAGVALAKSTWAGFRSRSSIPPPPAPEPNPYELEAEEYLRTLLELSLIHI